MSTDLKSCAVITSKRHKRQLKISWGGPHLGYWVCRELKANGRAGNREVIVKENDIATI